jgi:predicted membrane protein
MTKNERRDTMLMTKTFIWIIAILVALVGIIAATEVPVSGILIVIAAWMMTPLSPLPKWGKAIATRYEGSSHVFWLKTLVYILPGILLAIGFNGIGRHSAQTAPTTHTEQSVAAPVTPATPQATAE